MLSSIEKGSSCNLTAFSMCAHNGTHIDAPFHFINDGKTVDEIGLNVFVGMAYVAEHRGVVSGDDAAEILKKAKEQNPEAAKRILIKGTAEVSAEAAKVFASSELLLLGNESQTFGPEDAPMFAHLNDDVLFGEVWNEEAIDVKTKCIIPSIPQSFLKYILSGVHLHYH